MIMRGRGGDQDSSTRRPATTSPPSAATGAPPRWLNGALTGVVLASALVAALDHRGQLPDPIDDIAWILVVLASTGLVRVYAALVAGRAQWDSPRRAAVRLLANEWALIVAGLPAVVILLTGVTTGWPALEAVRAVLVVNVALLLGLGMFGARRSGYRPLHAVGFGIADAALGVLVIIANALLR
jgi:hypothetical protein